MLRCWRSALHWTEIFATSVNALDIIDSKSEFGISCSIWRLTFVLSAYIVEIAANTLSKVHVFTVRMLRLPWVDKWPFFNSIMLSQTWTLGFSIDWIALRFFIGHLIVDLCPRIISISFYYFLRKNRYVSERKIGVFVFVFKILRYCEFERKRTTSALEMLKKWNLSYYSHELSTFHSH